MYNNLDLRKILIKGLRVNYAFSGNKRVERILENKNKEDLEDLLQDLELMNLENATSKQMFSYINKWCYNSKKEENDVIELIINDDDDDVNMIDKISYINYINSNNYIENQRFNIDSLELTDRQKEILNIYATTQSMQKVADYLKISKSSVQKTIERLRSKLQVKSA